MRNVAEEIPRLRQTTPKVCKCNLGQGGSTVLEKPSRRFITKPDAWSQTITLLTKQSFSDSTPATGGQPRQGTKPRMASSHNRNVSVGANVRVLDRPSKSTAIVSWFDSTVCHYGEQMWRESRARESGTCALTGNSICPGDTIYRPRASQPHPLNVNAMILSSCLECANTDSCCQTPPHWRCVSLC